ncbi:conserved hypothetical protein [Desulfosarcina cetonica]|uniref:hypothetical protein n=1 Tax=Desulfosarcina cetonica TaxID=90730 RepID=UPI0006D2941B|nr:hypothetical protein [Desulfosarcina cetonica]VTR64669.1 conserved hypothetical protein [Desulfosarcina cetonica]
MSQKVDLSDMAEKWSSTVVTRTKIGEFSGGMITPGYMANLDAAGEGPADSFMMGGKKCYRVKSLISWLEARIETAAPPKTPAAHGRR